MKVLTKEEDMVSQPIDKIDKNLRHIFGLMVEKDFKTAATLLSAIKAKGTEETKQLAEGLIEVLGFVKDLTAGKEIRAAVRRLDTIIYNDELDKLLPALSDEDYADLKKDIEEKGIIAPLIVQDTPEGFLLIDGYTRYRIAKELGIGRVPVIATAINMEPKVLAIAVNLMRRHMSKESRVDFIKAIPIPKQGRPKKGEEVFSKAKIAKEMGISEKTVQRARQKKETNVPFSEPKPKRIKKICTPPDKEGDPIPEKKDWIDARVLGTLDKLGRMKGVGFAMSFTKDQLDVDLLVRYVDEGIHNLLTAVKDAGLEDKVANYRMTVTFEARKE